MRDYYILKKYLVFRKVLVAKKINDQGLKVAAKI